MQTERKAKLDKCVNANNREKCGDCINNLYCWRA